ncbi:hypothetical protein GOD44_05975 [Sinorhizobium medicae]|uniref:hypothetical protein n=1 Tax=Rhizobium meliloti TaxID=382 RepID=UPI000FD8B776|nr:hypothetical protein [Sinorhizobium meliloti]MDX0774005.1 hypothetical protein [Sinorhizobium medicae]RVN54337.1 hypothetical protein CN108_18280 [Sinorhizobium meliloti]
MTIIRGMEEHLFSAIECLERVEDCDDALVSASQALSAGLAASVACQDLKSSFPAIVAELCEALDRAAPELARATAGEIPSKEIEVGIRALRALLSEAEHTDRRRRQLHVGLLSSQLNALHCRRELEKRGGPLPRSAGFDHLASQASTSVH